MEISTGLSIGENLKCQQFDNSKESTEDVSCNPPSTDNRVRRATDEELSAEVERMQKVARLATGISIQLDLISGILDPNELISELLHLGSVTPAQIIAMSDTDIQDAITRLKSLPGKLSSHKNITVVETKLEDLMEIRLLVKEGGDGTEWVGKDAFITEMESVRDHKIGLEPVLNFDGLIGDWFTRRKDVVNPNLSVPNSDVIRLKIVTENITSSIPQLTAAAKNGVKLPNMFRAEEGVNPLSSLLAAISSQTKIADIKVHLDNEPIHLTSIVDNVERISDVSSTLQLPSIDTVKNVVKNRLTSIDSGSSKFPGFANGLSDVITLLDNLKDPWVKQFVKSNAMAASLKSLKQLEPLFQTSHSSLGSPRDVRFIQEIDDILMIPTDYSAIDDAIRNLFKCKTHLENLVTPGTDEVIPFLKSVKVLDEQIEKANIALKSLSDILDTTETKELLNDVIELCTTSNDPVEMQGIVDTLKNSTRLSALNQKFVAIESLRIAVFKTPKTQAEGIISNAPKVDNFISQLTSYHPFLKCLFQLSDDDVKLAKNGIDISRHMITRDPAVVTRGEAAINEVVFSGSSLKTLITAIENVKGYSSAESDALQSLPDHQKHSMTIGLATLRVSAMAMTLQKGQDLAVITRGFGVVGKNVNLVKNPEDVKNLRAVVRIGSSLDIMYQQVKTWQDGVNGTRSTVLASHSDIFSSAASITGMTGDFGAMAKSVGVLAEAVSDPNDKAQLNAVKSALESLATVNLNFASFTSNQMADPHASLSALDLFFANFNPIVSVTGGANSSGGGSLGPGQQLVLQSSTTDKAGSSSSILGIVIGGIVGAGVVAGAVGGILWFVRRRKMKKTSELVEVTARDENSETPDVSAPPSAELEQTQSDSERSHCSQEFALRYQKDLADRLEKTERVMEKQVEDAVQREWQEKVAEELKQGKPATRRPGKKAREPLTHGPIMEHFCEQLIAGSKAGERPDDLSVVKSHLNETRRFIALEPTTRVTLQDYGSRFETNYIHANTVTFPNGLKMVLTQTPMRPLKQGKMLARKSTIEKFWWMARQLRSKSVVLFHTKDEKDLANFSPFFPDKAGSKPMVFDKLKVTCVKYDAICEPKSTYVLRETREIRVEFEGESPFTVTLYQHNRFYPASAPFEVDCFLDILKTVRKDLEPVIVACTDGVSRSAAFAFTELEYQSLCRGESNLMVNLMTLRNQRSKSLGNPLQLAFCLAAVLDLAFDGKEPHFAIRNYFSHYHSYSLDKDELPEEPSAGRRKRAGLEDSEAGEEEEEEIEKWLRDRDEMERMVVPNRLSFAISRLLFSARRFVGWTRPMAPETRAVMRIMNEKTSWQLVDEAGKVV